MSVPAAQIHPLHPGLGASQVPIILGASPYTTPHELWEELTGVRPRFEGNLSTRIGQALEPIIATEFTALHGIKLVKGESVQHPEADFLWATPDYLTLDADGNPDGVLELKNCRYKSKVGGPHDMRPSHRIQVHAQLACRGLPKGRVFIHCMSAGDADRFELLTVERNPNIEEGIIQICRLFWDHVQAKQPLPESFNKRSP